MKCKQVSEEELMQNKVYTYEILPHKYTWKVTNKQGKETYVTKYYENFSYKCIINGNVIVVILNDGSKGIARCMPSDKFDFTKGMDIAYHRALIMSYQKKLKQLVK